MRCCKSFATAISESVNSQPPSPTIARIGRSGAATAAPMAMGSAQPSVPSPYGASQDRGCVAGSHQCALYANCVESSATIASLGNVCSIASSHGTNCAPVLARACSRHILAFSWPAVDVFASIAAVSADSVWPASPTSPTVGVVRRESCFSSISIRITFPPNCSALPPLYKSASESSVPTTITSSAASISR
ncbi:unannotated protein [freshwater metagenome]|uniref:Unannotated protein n=1 Tax=freshwater metagenome TaxID=449393 RepID=A0A6J6V4B0_9ZZZZ